MRLLLTRISLIITNFICSTITQSQKMKLVFATNNENKVREVKALLPTNIELLSLNDIGCFEEIIEDAITIEGNATLKASYIYNNYNYTCFADDTGLEIEALNGAPGVFSARYAGVENNSEANMQKVLQELLYKENRRAQFKTVISFYKEGKEMLFTGICKGEIIEAKKGDGGFGYDPIFLPEGFSETFAEMSLKQKSEIGHRGKAVSQLIEFLRK